VVKGPQSSFTTEELDDTAPRRLTWSRGCGPWLRHGWAYGQAAGTGAGDAARLWPLELLGRRFAAGEIDEDEYRRRSSVLRGEAPQHADGQRADLRKGGGAGGAAPRGEDPDRAEPGREGPDRAEPAGQGPDREV